MGFIICVGISISFGWKLSLVVLACVPVLIFCNHFVLKVRIGNYQKTFKIISPLI